MIVVDSNVWIALLDEADSQHGKFVDVSLLLLAKSHTVHTFDKKLARALKHPSEL